VPGFPVDAKARGTEMAEFGNPTPAVIAQYS